MNYTDIIKATIQREGGYNNIEGDAGGETKFGITKKSYPTLDIANLTEEQAIEIYRKDFIEKVNLHFLTNEKIFAKVFDVGVNMNPARAIRFLQEVVGAKVDGVLGAETANLANSSDEKLVIDGVRKLQILHYAKRVTNDQTQAKFMLGWVNRAYAL